MTLPGVAPAALALVFALWCGSLWHGTAALPAGVGYALLLAAVLVLARAARRGTGAALRDPWRLGAPGLLLPWALLAAVALATWASPVPRAGWVGLLLLPAYLWLPAAVARLWSSGAARRWGARAVCLGVAAVSGSALYLWLAGVTPRPSSPVGQHLHLTAWLLVLLPLAAVPWREGGAWRAAAVGAVGLGAAAILGTQTLSGLLGLGVEVVLALHWGGAGRLPVRLRTAFAAAAVVGLVAIGGAEMGAVLRGTDPSGAARFVYWRAGWEGVLERPAVGTGPGSTAWTLPLLLRPVPGINPSSEVVGELHLLPLAAAYELGLPAALLAAAAAGLFAWRRLRERRGRPTDPGFVVAGLAGLGGGAAAGLATGDWRVTALPVAAAVAAGAALAGGWRTGRPEAEDQSSGGEARPRRPRGWRRLAWAVPAGYALAAAALLAPLVLAHAAYDRAVDAPPEAALRALHRAVELDPRFPLYRARRAWIAGEREVAPASTGSVARGARRVALEAVAAAEDARGVPALWLAAGASAEAADELWAAALAYERACAADPLGAFAPFALARIGSPMHQPVAVAARALAAEPRLAAALWWRANEDLFAHALVRTATSTGIDEGWRAALHEHAAAIERPPGAAEAELAVVLDGRPEGSLSLHVFRRRPWRSGLAPVPVDAGAAAALTGLPPAVALESTDPRLFPPTCTGPFAPQTLSATPYRLDP